MSAACRCSWPISLFVTRGATAQKSLVMSMQGEEETDHSMEAVTTALSKQEQSNQRNECSTAKRGGPCNCWQSSIESSRPLFTSCLSGYNCCRAIIGPGLHHCLQKMPLPIAAQFLLHSPAASYAARAAGSSLLAGALARDLWRRIPEWIRQDIGFQDLFCTSDGYNNNIEDENAGGGGNDEMASLLAVIQKLQALVTIGHQKLGSKHKQQRRRRKVVRLLSST
eukprot:scaffold31809_cov66-Skeletonema_marinoi.AAC.2